MMENWLHSGIESKSLDQEFNKLKEMKFPEEPEEDELYDLFSELVSLDGHIAGLISTYLKGKQINYKLLYADDEFNEIRAKIQMKSDSLMSMDEYKKQLDLLVQIVKELERKS